MANLELTIYVVRVEQEPIVGLYSLMVEIQLQQHKLLLQRVMMTSHLELVILH